VGAARSTVPALAEVGTLLLGATGVVLAVGVVGSLAAADQDGPAFAVLLAVALTAALAWPTAWVALRARRATAAAVAAVLGVLASVAVPLVAVAGSGTGADAWRALVMPVVVAAALVAVVLRARRERTAPGLEVAGPGVLAVAVLVVAVSIVADAALARAAPGLGGVLDVSSVVLAVVLAGVGLAAAARLGPARTRAVGLLLVVGPVVSQAALVLRAGPGAGAAATLLRWGVLVALLGLAVVLLVRGSVEGVQRSSMASS
jgi:hypothetical protein